MPFEHTAIVVAAALAVTLLLVWLITRPRRGARYEKKPWLFSPAERAFHDVLRDSMSSRYRVFGKVRVADIITPQTSMARGDWQRAFNRVSAKHFDFVLCDRHSLAVVCAIELDDKSHERVHRRRRDEFLDAACRSAEMPLVRFAVSRSYDADTVRLTIERTIAGDR